MNEKERFKKSVQELERALTHFEKAKQDTFYYSGIAKSFEVCLEYAWKYLQSLIQDQGVDVYSPKETFKLAGRLDLIDDVEKWLRFLTNRNLSVHDYLGHSDEKYLGIIQDFFSEAQKLLNPR